MCSTEKKNEQSPTLEKSEKKKCMSTDMHGTIIPLIVLRDVLLFYRFVCACISPLLPHYRWSNPFSRKDANKKYRCQCIDMLYGNQSKNRKAKKATMELDTKWKDGGIRKGLKMKLVKALMWPVIAYGAEGWTLKKDDERRLEAAEMWRYAE